MVLGNWHAVSNTAGRRASRATQNEMLDRNAQLPINEFAR